MFQTAYGTKQRTPLDFTGDPGYTEQNHKDACDVNLIIKRFDTQGVLTHINEMEKRYGDVSGADFARAMEIVQQGQAAFDDLPSDVRARFQNNPALFLDFCNQPGNEEQLVAMGLATRKEVEGIVRPETETAVTETTEPATPEEVTS